MIAFDTNVLLYAHDPRDPRKQAIAIDLIQRERSAVLLWQVACEYLAASRKLANFGYMFVEACKDLEDLRLAWPLILPSWNVIERAGEITTSKKFAFWDAMIVAGALEAKVERIFSEDLADCPSIDGLISINPFAG